MFEERERNSRKRLIFVLLLVEITGVGILMWDLWQGRLGDGTQLNRGEPGEGSYTQEMEIDTKYYRGNYTVEVEERKLSEKEIAKLFQKAREEVDETFLGKNKDLEHITEDVTVSRQYQNGLVSADWYFDDDTKITSEGIVQAKEITTPQLIQATVVFRCQKQEERYSFPIRVVPVKKTSAKGILLEIEREIQDENKESSTLSLPETIYNEKVGWKKKMSFRGIAVMVLGVAMIWLVPQAQRWEEKRKEEERKIQLERDYPQLVGQISLLLGVGLSLPEVVERMRRRYERSKDADLTKKEGFRLLAQMGREMKDGVCEQEALEHFGKNAGIKEYRKLALLLSQYQKKGNANLRMQLEKEDINGFEMRKCMAKKMGEEASMKLLLPMMGMLAMVLVMILFPALIGLQVN